MFLIDSGASLCVLKNNSITNNQNLLANDIKVKGIDTQNDYLKSIGSLNLQLELSPKLKLSTHSMYLTILTYHMTAL